MRILGGSNFYSESTLFNYVIFYQAFIPDDHCCVIIIPIFVRDTSYFSLFIVHCSLFTVNCSLFIIHYFVSPWISPSTPLHFSFLPLALLCWHIPIVFLVLRVSFATGTPNIYITERRKPFTGKSKR